MIEAAACLLSLDLRLMLAGLCTYMKPENALHLWPTLKESVIEVFSTSFLMQTMEKNTKLQSVDAPLIKNGINCLTVGLPETTEIPQLDHHEDLDHPGMKTLTDEQADC